MSSKRQYQKRNRPVLACYECQRRKQKCDRERPCGQCAARNASFKCAYTDDNGALRASDNGQKDLEDDLTDSTSVAGRLGYGSLSDIKEALDALQRGSSQPKVASQAADASRPPAAASSPVNFGKARSLSTKLRLKYDSCIACLPSNPIIEMLLDTFFTEVDWYFTIIDRPYFMSLHQVWADERAQSNATKIEGSVNKKRGLDAEGNRAELLYFSAVLLQVLALTLQFLPTKSLVGQLLDVSSLPAADRLSRVYSDAGAEVMSLLGRHDSASSAVLADLLRCAWLKNTGRGNEAWFSLGDAVRQAQNLGLHLQQPVPCGSEETLHSSLQNLWYDEHRRRLWVSLFAWDSHMAMMLGRSRMINAADCTILTPLDCDFPIEPFNTVPAPAAQFGRPSTYTSQLVKYETGYKAHQMMSAGVLSQHCKDHDLVMKFHSEILGILNSLPPASSPQNPDTTWDESLPVLPKHRQHISIVINSFLVALHRPHAMYSPISREAGIRAALATLASQQGLFNLLREHQYRIHSLTCYTLDAAMFLTSMVVRRKTSSPLQNQDDGKFLPLRAICIALNQAQTRLEKAKARSAVAGAAAKIIHHCLLTIRRSIRGLPVESREKEADSPSFPSTDTNTVDLLDASASGTSSQNYVVTPQSDNHTHHTTSLETKNGHNSSLSTSLGAEANIGFGDPLATERDFRFDFCDMLDLDNPDDPTFPFGGLQFDVDLQTGLWMEQIGLAENTFEDPELEGFA